MSQHTQRLLMEVLAEAQHFPISKPPRVETSPKFTYKGISKYHKILQNNGNLFLWFWCWRSPSPRDKKI